MMWVASTIIIIALVIGLIGTLYSLKQEENKVKQYESEGQTFENELQRSHEYESKSLKHNLKNLTWIYTIVIVLSFIGLAIYISLL